jgi:hypothetical protein
MRLFFSRRIGLSEAGDAIPILGGTRLTGRRGAYSIGALNIQQREDGPVPATNFTAVRMRRDILRNSDIGAIFLNKEENGTGFNRVGGIDANFRFGVSPSFAVNTFIAKTLSPTSVVGTAGNDLAIRGSARYEDRTWQFAGRREAIGERFHNEMGFNQRIGVNNTYLYAARRIRPGWAARWLRESRVHWQFDMFSRQDGTGLESRIQDFHVPMNFQDGSSMETGVNTNVEVVRVPFAINGARGVRVQPGRYEFDEYFIFWNTNAAKRISFQNRYSQGGFYDGTRRSYSWGPALRLNEQLNTSVVFQVQDVELSTDQYVSTLVTGRVNYNFNTRMFVNALLQYNTDSRQWSSNIRFNVIHRPLSDFFLVYNERRDERSGELLDRAVIAKMTYLMAF